MHRILRKARRFLHRFEQLQRLKLFDRLSHKIAYYRCGHRPYLKEPVELRVRAIPVALACRPRTSDAAVLWGTFGERFHRPPRALPEGALILDLGANVGYTAVDFAVSHPRARVVAVEMDAANVAVARRNLEPFGDRVTVVHAAIWSHDGEVGYAGADEWGFYVRSDAEETAGLRTAPAMTMPTLMKRYSIERVDYLKMDVEGAESEVLTPDSSWLRRCRLLQVEVHPPATLSGCEAALRAHGFSVKRHLRHGGCLIASRDGTR